ncbi:MAG: hypothetical protein PHD48_08135, partial [Alphaproteobacteria bacterium]|nr:hypothetical protein [Alphaproteobacteria bacterium]
NGMTAKTDTISGLFMNKPFYDNYGSTGPVLRVRACYDHLRNQREGEVHMFFAEWLVRARMFYAIADRVQALRVHKMLPLPPTLPTTVKRERAISEVATRLNDLEWTAASISAAAKTPPEIARLAKVYAAATSAGKTAAQAAMAAVGGVPEIVTEAPRMFDDERPPAGKASSTGASSEGRAAQPVTWAPAETDQSVETGSYEDDDYGETAARTSATSAAGRGASGTSRGFMPQEIDTAVVPKVGGVEDAEADVTKLKLPEDITAYIEGMASKFNKGLGGEASKESE